jgi:hypothetical protein
LSGVELTDKSKVFTHIIADHYNAEFIDLSLSGIGNESISLIITNYILEYLSKNKIDPKTTLVLINWTFVERLIFFSSKDAGWFTVREERLTERHLFKSSFFQNDKNFDAVKLYYENHRDELFLLYYLSNIIHKTKTFLEAKGFDKYVFSFSDEGTKKLMMRSKEYFKLYYRNVFKTEGFRKFDSILNDIDYTKFFDLPFMEFSLKEKYDIGKGGHPLEAAHIDYSKLLLEFIEKRYGN